MQQWCYCKGEPKLVFSRKFEEDGEITDGNRYDWKALTCLGRYGNQNCSLLHWQSLGSFWGGLYHRWNLTSGYVHLQNSFEILVLGPQLCPLIWAYTMIGLLKKALSFCQSGWREVQRVDVRDDIHRVQPPILWWNFDNKLVEWRNSCTYDLRRLTPLIATHH